MKFSRYLTLSSVVAAALLSGCERKPEGQVVAVVNGDEITISEVNEELKGTPLPQGADRRTLQQAAVHSLVQRRLLASAAKDDGIDKDPTFLVQRKQMEDKLLVQMLAQRGSRTMARPDPGEVNAFMAANPGAFASRILWKIDRLQFGVPQDQSILRALEGEHSMEGVIARLKAASIPFTQDSSQLDSAMLAQDAYAKIAGLPTGEPFVRVQNGVATVGAILSREAAPLTGPQAQSLATERLLSQRVNERLDNRLKALQASAKISYQKGFAPQGQGAGQ